MAPALGPAGERLALKVGWRHPEAEHEADALRLWDGDGAVRCLAACSSERTAALLLERCEPGTSLAERMPESERDPVIAGLLKRLWAHALPPEHPFDTLGRTRADWARDTWHDLQVAERGEPGPAAPAIDTGLVRAGLELLGSLAAGAEQVVALCTDLHTGNVLASDRERWLASDRESWLAVDPKPCVGDPAYDAVQHLLNCMERLSTDPAGLARRMAELLEVDPERVSLWLFARCAQESLYDETMREPARRLAP